MTEESQQEKKGFQIVDKRRFDSAGETRSLSEEASKETSTSENKPLDSDRETTNPQMTTEQGFTMAESSNQQDEPVAFTSFVMSLATQVLVQLGEMPPPTGMEIPRDLDSARQTIDILTMLQARTRGNLSSEEVRFLEEVLHSLRMSYINAKKKPA
jgi:hypothetical protein